MHVPAWGGRPLAQGRLRTLTRVEETKQLPQQGTSKRGLTLRQLAELAGWPKCKYNFHLQALRKVAVAAVRQAWCWFAGEGTASLGYMRVMSSSSSPQFWFFPWSQQWNQLPFVLKGWKATCGEKHGGFASGEEGRSLQAQEDSSRRLWASSFSMPIVLAQSS
eukprot:CAMPEP_0179156004 /NCGR_PEP_ID=MMETSP0796-20121207/76026_1 /TAXON_ID=73915 /ORGANISM="Pyrodinium bahamense, Strain pbaha01" /LENGTH=162 /DNA_ID=CAMNT_0020857541 /DNA_START=1 /DNA_END=486 /DNA_ORIENTATION=+